MTNSIYSAFPHEYVFRYLDELPANFSGQRYFYPGGMTGQDGVLIRVTPKNNPDWIGMFAFGKFGNTGVTCALSMPDPKELCVVSLGAGIIVESSSPDRWRRVEISPIRDVRCISAAGLVVFTNHTEMIAYDVNGVRWRTVRLSWDDLRVIEVGDHEILGEYWDIREDAMKNFKVNLATGEAWGAVTDVWQ